jgi:hypothetical protein
MSFFLTELDTWPPHRVQLLGFDARHGTNPAHFAAEQFF